MGWIFWLLFLIPLTLFIVIVLPLILWMSSRRQQQAGNMLSEREARRLDELMVESQKMRERIQVLESILDEEYPRWRGRYE
jgi:phage shock protein B